MNSEFCFEIKELEEILYILEGVSDNMFASPNVSVGKRGAYILSGESIISVGNTLKTIDFCCQREFFSDAFTLARKYRDDVLQYIFVSSIIKNMHGLSQEELDGYFEGEINEKVLLEVLKKEFEILCSGERKNSAEMAIELWMYGDLDKKEYSWERGKYFDASKYIKNLLENKLVREIFEKHLKDIWYETDRILNNYVHSNGRRFVLDNYAYGMGYQEQKVKLVSVVQNITSIFLALMSITEPTKLQSSDYQDAIESGMVPKSECQYYVMPNVVEYMDKHFSKELLNFIEVQNEYKMKFLLEDYL